MQNKTELVRISRLAKLSLLAEETDGMLADISDIVKVAQSIGNADLTGYDCSGESVTSELREDVAAPSTPAAVLLSSAADTHDGFFCGPR